MGDDVDNAEADLVAILADQVVKEESKRLRPGFRNKKKGAKAVAKKKISQFKIYTYSIQLSIQYTAYNSSFTFPFIAPFRSPSPNHCCLYNGHIVVLVPSQS